MTNEERYKILFGAYLAGQVSTTEFCDQAERLGEEAQADLACEETAPANASRHIYTGRFADQSQRVTEYLQRPRGRS